MKKTAEQELLEHIGEKFTEKEIDKAFKDLGSIGKTFRKCWTCGKEFKKLDEHTYKPNCKHLPKNWRLSVG